MDSVEILDTRLDVPDQQFVLPDPVLRERISVANLIQRVDVWNAQQETPAGMRLKRAGGNQEALPLQATQIFTMGFSECFVDFFQGKPVADDGKCVHLPDGRGNAGCRRGTIRVNQQTFAVIDSECSAKYRGVSGHPSVAPDSFSLGLRALADVVPRAAPSAPWVAE